MSATQVTTTTKTKQVRDVRGFWRVLLAAVAPVPMLFMGLYYLISPVDGNAPFATTLAAVTADPGRFELMQWLQVPFFLLIPAMFAAAWAARRTAPRLATAGGLLAIEDYCRATLRRIPEPPEWENFLKADLAFFASQGGDANIGARLPELYERAGLTLVDVTPTIKFGRPGSPVWNWVSGYFMGVMSQLGKYPPFTSAQADRLRRNWLQAGTRATSLLIAPTLVDVVGRKRNR